MRWLLIITILGACAAHDEQDTRRDSLASIGLATEVSDIFHPGHETAVAVVPRTYCSPIGCIYQGPSVVVQFNRAGLSPLQAWGVSTDGGNSWRTRDSSYWPPATRSGVTVKDYALDPALAWTGFAGQVAGSSLFYSSTAVLGVAVVVSDDGGLSFTQPIMVSPLYGSGSVEGVDYPRMAADTFRHQLWILFTAHPDGDELVLRRITCGNAAASSCSLDTSYVDPNYQGFVGMRLRSRLKANPGQYGSFSLAVRPATHDRSARLYIAYPQPTGNTDWWFNHNRVTCETGGTGGAGPVDWHLAWSDDEGLSWRDIVFTNDAALPRCATPTVGGENQVAPAIAYDALSDFVTVVIPQNVTKRCGIQDLPAGMHVVAHQIGPNGEYQAITASCKLDGDGAGHIAGTLDCDEPDCTQFQPASAAAPRGLSAGHVALAWHDTRDGHPDHISIFGAWFRPGLPFQQVWPTLSRVTPVTAPGAPPCSKPQPPGGVPFCYNDVFDSGDYDGMAADPTSGRLYTAWSDLRNAPDSQVWSASFEAY